MLLLASLIDKVIYHRLEVPVESRTFAETIEPSLNRPWSIDPGSSGFHQHR